MYNFNIFILFLIVLESCRGVEYNKQRYNPSTDFLAHEAGSSVWTKRDYVAPSNNDYNAQFPSLGSPHSQPTTSQSTSKPATSPSGKRDYVAPQLPTPKPQQPDNRDYVVLPSSTQRTQPTGKRDYVAPQFTTKKPDMQNSATVKELVNFFDSQPKNQNGPQNIPSYSNILQGNNNSGPSKQPVTPSTLKATLVPPTKPLSFSAVAGGSVKPQTPTSSSTLSPSTQITPSKPTGHGNLNPTARPGSPVLPSTLVNRNKNSNQGNSNGPSDAEIQTVSEELLRKDSNNAARYVTINYQQKTTSQSKEDKAPQPLLTVASDAWNIPTIQKLMPLLDNYERDTMINEYVTAQERNEENAFMDAIMSTSVIRHLMNFLKEKGYVSPDPRQQRDFLKQLWFNLYSRGKGKISSSGFEHVFVSELKNGDVQGLHNWIYFSKEEAANRLNYLGYLKYQQLDDKGAVLKLHFTQQGVDKPVDTMFIGTSPELEIALYTLCFVTRADNECKLKLGRNDVNIVTHTFRYRSKNYIGSAYPQI